jgi:hypothetical protein
MICLCVFVSFSHQQAEFTYVPEHVSAGAYLLSLQIAPIELDASPTRPLLFAISNIKLE